MSNFNPAHNRVNLIGAKLGRLTVLAEAAKGVARNGVIYRTWLCECACGNKITKRTGQLSGKPSRFELSCGCSRVEKNIARQRTHGFAGKGRPPEYEVWRAMRRRCRNKNCSDFQYYGARGIDICPRWEEFSAFYADMGPRPTQFHSIDRIDVNANYSPENCRWATAVEQRRNQRRMLAA